MTGTLYTGNPAYPPPSAVQLLADSDPQRATSYNPGLQALADQIAYQMRLYGPSRMGSISDMQAISDARESELFHVKNSGYFQYFGGVLATNSPIVVAATGMGVGAWVSDLYSILFNASSPAKIIPALISNSIIAAGEFVTSTAGIITYTTATSTFAPLKEDGTGGTNLVRNTVSNAKASDRLYLWVGPVSVIYGGSGYAEIRVKISRGFDVYYPKITAFSKFEDFALIYNVPSDGDVTVSVEVASSDNTATHSFASPSGWGVSGAFSWAHYQLIRA